MEEGVTYTATVYNNDPESADDVVVTQETLDSSQNRKISLSQHGGFVYHLVPQK